MSDYEHVELGRTMAKMLRERYGDAALSKIPECRKMAAGNALQLDTVRMAEKFLAIWAVERRP